MRKNYSNTLSFPSLNFKLPSLNYYVSIPSNLFASRTLKASLISLLSGLEDIFSFQSIGKWNEKDLSMFFKLRAFYLASL